MFVSMEAFKTTPGHLSSDQKGLVIRDFPMAWWLIVQALWRNGLVSAYYVCHFGQVPELISLLPQFS